MNEVISANQILKIELMKYEANKVCLIVIKRPLNGFPARHMFQITNKKTPRNKILKFFI